MGITVLLAHSVPGIRKLEKALLEKEPDVEVVGIVDCSLRSTQGRARAFKNDFARLSHCQSRRVANKELRAKCVFKSTNLLAKCRLTDVQALGSTSEAQIGRYLNKVAELS